MKNTSPPSDIQTEKPPTFLTLNLLGGCEVLNATEASLKIPAKKNLAILAYLAMSPGKKRSRETLATLFWERSAESQARSSLRQALSSLCRQLNTANVQNLIVDRDLVLLKIPDSHIDALLFQRLASMNSPELLEKSADLYQGDFLQDFNIVEDDFFEWKLLLRRQLHETILGVYRQLVAHYFNQGDNESTIHIAERSLHLDPVQGFIHRALMQVYVRTDRRESALSQYESCKQIFSRELNINPDPETRQLAREIQHLKSDPNQARNEITLGRKDQENKAFPANIYLDTPAPVVDQNGIRLITVMICTLDPMNKLVSFNNAKLLADILARYKTVSKQTVDHFNGLMVNNYSDQLIFCFGCRQILRKGPERAIRAAQSLINSVNQLACPAGIQLHPRFGIATGKLMMTHCPQEHPDSQLVITGSVVHLAARLNTLASPDQILISDSAFQLAGRLFNYREAGHFQSPDEDKLETLWEVTGKNRRALSPLPAHLPITPLQPQRRKRNSKASMGVRSGRKRPANLADG